MAHYTVNRLLRATLPALPQLTASTVAAPGGWWDQAGNRIDTRKDRHANRMANRHTYRYC